MNRLALLAILTSCSSAPSETDDITATGFHAEIEPLKGFSFDSGQVPAGSPVTINVKASAGGKLTLDAPDASPGAGLFALDAGIELGATIKSELPGIAYEGPIQGLPALSIQLVGETMFDAMSIGKPATLTADVAPLELATIPLATALGVPAVTGDLTIEIKGGTLTSTFTGTCADAGRYAGTLTVGGTVTLGGKLLVEVPLLGAKTFDLPAMAMQIPPLDTMLAFATPDDPMASGCKPAAGGGNNNGGNNNGDPHADPNHLWDIHVYSATYSRPGGFDPDGLSDPFVVIEVNGTEYQASVRENSNGSATWNELVGTITTAEMEAEGYSLILLDRDTMPGEFLGGPALDPDHPNDDYIAGMSSAPELGDNLRFDSTFGGITATVRYGFVPH